MVYASTGGWPVRLATLPLLLISDAYIFKEKIKVAFNDVRNAVGKSRDTFVQEHLTGMNIVQILRAENPRIEKFHLRSRKSNRQSNLRSVLYHSDLFSGCC